MTKTSILPPTPGENHTGVAECQGVSTTTTNLHDRGPMQIWYQLGKRIDLTFFTETELAIWVATNCVHIPMTCVVWIKFTRHRESWR
mmetsp:Transcript_28217/g.70834  ORF Transcript_28217/g.70834 Transcript_28217/m.70834 type:complete len:87 (+) Transcript_28217:1901-2161(+)